MSNRERLPARRPSMNQRVIWRTETGEHPFYVTIGFCPSTGRALEVFYADGQRIGSTLQHTLTDACVLISLLLQRGATPSEIGKSLGTVPVLGRDRPATVVGSIVEALEIEACLVAGC